MKICWLKCWDFSVALKELKVEDEDYELLTPSFHEIIDALSVVKDEGTMIHRHRLQCLSATLVEVTNRLRESDLFISLKTENEEREFVTKVDITALTKWRVMKQKDLSRSD